MGRMEYDFALRRIAYDEQVDFNIVRERYVCSRCKFYDAIFGCHLYSLVSRLSHAIRHLSGHVSSQKGPECSEREDTEDTMVCMHDLDRHDLKILPVYFEDVISLKKKFELRKDDRDYKVGDFVFLHEWEPDKGHTGRCFYAQITYILRDHPDYGLMDGYIIFGW